MGCGCNDKKKACDKGEFPQAVIEIKNPSQLLEFRKVVVKASLGDDTTYPPKVGMFCNTILYYEANDQVYLYSSDGIPTKITVDIEELKRQIAKLREDLTAETIARENADADIWEEIEEIEMSSDVVDIVGTYAELQQYDTSKLHDNDIIKVIQDETHQDETAYYRWSTTTNTFSYVGSEGPYYTESEIDTMMAAKQDKTLRLRAAVAFATPEQSYWAFGTGESFLTFTEIANAYDEKTILVFEVGQSQYYKVIECSHTSSTAQLVMTDGTKFITYTYVPNPGPVQDFDNRTFTRSVTNVYSSAFTGATASADGVQGLVPGPLAGDQDKYLKGDGTWGEVATVTTFYTDTFGGSQVYFYKNEMKTIKATFAEVADALGKGPVRIVSDDAVAGQVIYVREYWDDLSNGTLELLFDDTLLYTNKYVILSVVGSAQPSADALFHLIFLPNYILPTASSNTLGGIKVGSNLSITNGVLSANTLVGTDGTANGAAGYVPAPLIADAGKFLKADGTWSAVDPGGTIFYFKEVQTDLFTFYTDSACTAVAKLQDMFDAMNKGSIYVQRVDSDTVNLTDKYIYPLSLRMEVDKTSTPAEVTNLSVAFSNFSGVSVVSGWNNPTRLSDNMSSLTITYTPYTTSLPAANASTAGVGKLYTTTGQNTDGAVTQKLFTDTVGDIETALQILNSGAGVPNNP